MSRARLRAGQTAFLDRDGTINRNAPEGEYNASPDDIALLDGAAAAIRALNEAAVHAVVVTNQRGIALGRMTEADLAAVNQRLADLLAAEGARLDAILHCPHDRDECDCRKPGTGMLERAARKVPGVSTEGAAMVGDKGSDVEAGRRLGLTTVRIGPSAPGDPEPSHAAADLAGAVAWLLGEG